MEPTVAIATVDGQQQQPTHHAASNNAGTALEARSATVSGPE